MKKIILTPAAVLLIGFSAFSQTNQFTGIGNVQPGSNQIVSDNKPELSYELHGCYQHPVTKTILDKANTLVDFIDGYPANWIDEYISVEILAINNGQEMRALSTNDKLTTAQVNILRSADLNSDIDINVKYKSLNTSSSASLDKNSNVSVKTINLRLTVIPETEAQYASGQKAMNKYLKETIINKIPESVTANIEAAEVIFTINLKGYIEGVKLLKSSGDAKTDQLMIDSITKMPKWKPAENAKGVKVKQYFQFTVGVFGC